MSTLLQKAMEIRRRLESGKSLLLDSDEELLKNIPEEERQNVLSQIDNIIRAEAENKNNTILNFTPIHNDSAIPVITNITAFVLITVISLYFLFVFNMDQKNIVAVYGTEHSAESKIVEVLIKESEEKLKAKEGEIESIRGRLNLLNSEHDKIREEAENSIKNIEKELRFSMEERLEAERLKLQKEGTASEDIDRKLDIIYANLESDFQKQLQISRTEYLREEKKREEEILKMSSRYEEMIGEAESDLSKLETDIAQYRAEAAEKEKENSLTKQKYEKLSADREMEKLINEQIQSGYFAAGRFIDTGGYVEAGKKIDSLEEYLKQNEIASLPFIQERRGMDLLLIKSLRNLIKKDEATDREADKNISESLSMLSRISSRFSEGNILYRKNDYTGAEKSYSEAASLLPEMKAGIDNLKNIERERHEETLAGKISLTENERSLLDKFYRKESSRSVLSANLSKFRNIIEVTDEQKRDRAQYLVPSLRTKLKVKEILSSGEVKNVDPDLYKKLEEYIRAYGREKENSGREKGYYEVNNIIRSLINSDVSVYYQVDENEELEFYFLLDGLEKLIGY